MTADEIKAQTATYFGISVDDLEGPSRSKTLVGARQIAVTAVPGAHGPVAAGHRGQFGNRDHTTVMHADRKIRTGIGENRALRTGRRPHQQDQDICLETSLDLFFGT